MMAATEAGRPPVWERYLVIDQNEWRREIESLRDRGEMVNDDCTLLILRPALEHPDAIPASREDS